MGIFGFLSKSHIEQQREVQRSTSAMAQIDAQIKNEEGYILRQKELISKLEKREESMAGRTDFNIDLEQKKITDLQNALASSVKYDEQELNRLNGSLSKLDAEVAALQASKGGIFSNKEKRVKELVESQKPQRDLFLTKSAEVEDRIQSSRQKYEASIESVRDRIEAFQANSLIDKVEDPKSTEYEDNIRSAHGRIVDFQSERFQHESDVANLEVEVGPIKYIAALIEDMGVENIMLAEAVRVVILILVFVFDPLAVVMLLAANMSFRQFRQRPYERLRSVTMAPLTATTPAPTTVSPTTAAPTTPAPTTPAPTTPAPTTPAPTTPAPTTPAPTTLNPDNNPRSPCNFIH